LYSFRVFARFSALTLLALCASWAQVTGDLVVRVADASGGVVSQAAVQVRQSETGATRKVLTDENGSARISLLNLGRYEISVEKGGFEEQKARAQVTSGAAREVRVVLTITRSRQEVTVEDSAVAINTVSPQLQATIESRQVSELPLSGTGVLTLAGATPGVVPVSTRNPFLSQGNYASNGNRGRANHITIDSAVATDVTATGAAGFGTVSEYLVREVTVISNNFNAEFGRNSGSQFQVLTKSGSNEFRGQAWEVFRNDKLNARDYFDRTGKTAPLRDNRWGGYFGGPVIQNRLHFLAHYEQQTIRGAGGTRVATTWRPEQVAAITDPTARATFERFKGPEFTSPTGTRAVTSPLTTDSIAASARLDWNISQRDTLFGRWAMQDRKDRNPGLTFLGGSLPTIGAAGVDRPQTATLNYTRIWSPTLVWNALASFSRNRPAFAPLEDFGGPLVQFQDGTSSLGTIWILPQGRVQNSYQYLNNVTWTRGAHTVKGGYELGRVQANSFFDNNVRGTLTFANFASFASGQPALYTQRFGNSVRGHRVWSQAAFLQDDWRVTPRLTINAGLRLEIAGGVTEVNNINSNLNLDRRQALGQAGEGPLGTIDMGGSAYQPNYNWGPRFGFAWNPRGGRTSVRGGYGIAYDFLYLNPISNIRTSPPYMYQFTQTAFTGDDTFGRLMAGTSAFQQTGQAAIGTFNSPIRNFGAFSPVDQGLRNPQTQQWSLTLEREWLGTVWRASYVGTKSNYLQRTRPLNLLRPDLRVQATSLDDERQLIASGRLAQLNAGLNAPAAGQGLRIDPRFNAVNYLESSANSHYHGLQLWMQRRFHRTLAMTAAYTWGKSIDDVSDALGVLVNDAHTQQNPLNNRDNRAVSAFDVPHRLAVTHVWDLPWFRSSRAAWLKHSLGGWSWNGLFQVQSGQPLNLFSGVRQVTGATAFADPLFLGGGGSQRPNLVGALNLPLQPDPGAGARNPNLILASGLQQPLIGNFGTLGRNVARQNGLTQYDLSLQKEFGIADRLRVQLQAQAYNAFNNTSFSRPGQSLQGPANFGYYQDTDTNTRSLVMVLRLMF
jgi:hypothetical protein